MLIDACCFSQLAYFSDAGQGTIGTAIFNNGGVSGWVRFVAFEGGVTVIANLEGIDVDATWKILELPVLTTIDPAVRASGDFLGEIYNPITPEAGGCSTENPDQCMVGDLTGR